MVRDEGAASMARGMGPNVVRAVLMNASQLASYDWFKEQLIRSGHMTDGFGLHFTASFAAVSIFNDISLPFYLNFLNRERSRRVRH